jgi:hypothetical protein
MRNYLLLITLFSFGILHAQKLVLNEAFIINLGKNNYLKSKVHLEDGSIKDGYVLEFHDEPVIKHVLEETLDGFKMIENQMGLQKDFYFFREIEKGKDEKIGMKDIKRIEVEISKYNSHILEPLVFEKVKLSWANNDSSMNFQDRYTLLPIIISNSKITVYGVSLNEYPRFYLKNKEDEYAVIPVKITASDVFNQRKVTERYLTSMHYLGKDCPAYLTILESYKNAGEANPLTKMQKKTVTKDFTNSEKSIKKSYSEDLKIAKKNLKKDELRDYRELRKFQLTNELMNFHYNTYFNEMVIQYINSCD